jgi:hypothetical protein
MGVRVTTTIALVLGMAGCTTSVHKSPTDAVLRVPASNCPITIDGALNEPCYRPSAPVRQFTIAGEPHRRPAATSAWLFWTSERFVFAFDCDDTTPVASLPTAHERDVDPQDRVELFLWSGRETDGYYCLEIAPLGSVHGYRAKFYRQFDDTWTPQGWEFVARRRPGGYCVEAALSRAAVERMGFSLRAGERWRAGLFRADFAAGKPETPDWITWVDARTPQPDFHVAAAFGTITLEASATRRPD